MVDRIINWAAVTVGVCLIVAFAGLALYAMGYDPGAPFEIVGFWMSSYIRVLEVAAVAAVAWLWLGRRIRKSR